jgi:uncharacterized RDD family membrane protein YckC
MRYAGWWQRVGASVIDGLIGIPFAAPGWIAFIAGPKTIESCSRFDGRPGLCEVPTGGTIALGAVLYVVGLVAYAVIQIRKVARTGQTWGKQATGYRIVDASTGGTIGTGRAVGRYFATTLSGCACYLGFLWPLWDSQRRTFHDMIVKTRAIRV